MADQRGEFRKPLDIYMNKYVGQDAFMVRTADISTSGIYLHKLIEPELDDGTSVSLEFQLPESEDVIWARGVVMRESKRWGAGGVGIWFSILPEGYRKQIERFIYKN
jgi:c-di-GMP-binding flagellar brake protein YcgR